MATTIVNHKVKDFDSWKIAFDSDEPKRAAAGATLLAMGRKSDDPDMVYIIFDVKNMDNMHAMFNSPELQQNMQAAGVISKPEMVVLN